MFCGFLGVLFLSFHSCFRIFSVASVRTFFYTVISPPPRPKFRFSLGFPLLMPPLSAVSFPNRLPPRNFSEIPRFHGAFHRAAVPSAAYFLSCAAFLPSSVVSFSTVFFAAPPHLSFSFGFISKPPLPLNFPVVFRFSAARGCRFSAFCLS